mgnify:CR=1 FL=1
MDGISLWIIGVFGLLCMILLYYLRTLKDDVRSLHNQLTDVFGTVNRMNARDMERMKLVKYSVAELKPYNPKPPPAPLPGVLSEELPKLP